MTKAPEKISVQLDEPIQQGSELVSTLNFRKPKAKDMRGLKFPLEAGSLLDLALAVGDQPKSVMDELSAGDTLKVIELMASFLQGGQKTGTSG